MLAILSMSMALAACASVARVTNLRSTDCAARMQRGLSEILIEQGESADAGESLARQTLSALAESTRGPRPFLVAAPSGTDYEFFVQKKRDACLLRLYGRYHGFVSYTNNLTYIATRPLAGCECSE
jgi:hypothetical protein